MEVAADMMELVRGGDRQEGAQQEGMSMLDRGKHSNGV